MMSLVKHSEMLMWKKRLLVFSTWHICLPVDYVIHKTQMLTVLLSV